MFVHLTDMVGKTGKPSYTQRILLLSVLGRAGKALLAAAWPSALQKGCRSALNLKELLPFLALAADETLRC